MYRKHKKFYRAWAAMKQRCSNSRVKNYNIYGGRGIKYCKRWDKFENFYLDMFDSFEKSSKKNKETFNVSLDRIDNNKGYYKNNCRWATKKEQANNRNRCIFIVWGGITKNLTQWAEYLGIKQSTLRQRYFSYKWSIEKCLTFKR